MATARLAALLFAFITTSAACKPWYTRPCLSTDDPRTARTREGWAEAHDESLPWAKRVCAIESVASRFGDYTDRSDEPMCRPEIAYRLEQELFDQSPIAYDRLQIARIVALSRVGDTTEVMPFKAEVLIRLSDLSDEDIDDYQRAPEEVGPSPPARWLTRLALHSLARSNLFLNVPAARDYQIARRLRAADDIERRILFGAVATHFMEAVWGHPARAVDNGSFALFDRMRSDIEAALERPLDRLSFDLLLDHLTLAGTFAKRFGRAENIERIAGSILARKADVPACAGNPAARRDLYVVAALARLDAKSDLDMVEAPEPERPPRDQERLVQSVIEGPLYEHGADCRGQGARELFLPGLLAKVKAGTLPAEPTAAADIKDTASMIFYLSERPSVIAERTEVRDFVLRRAEHLLRTNPNSVNEHDLAAVSRALLAIPPAEPELRDDSAHKTAARVLEAMLADLRAVKADQYLYYPRHLHEIHLLGRHARAFHLVSEVTPLIEQLSAIPGKDRRRPSRIARAAAAASAFLDTTDGWVKP